MLNALRIEAVDIFELVGSLREPFHWAGGSAFSRQATLVRVRTSSGIVGWGESLYDTGKLLRRLASGLIGENALDRSGIINGLRSVAPWQDHVTCEAIGALEVALWDVAARAAGLPLCEHISGIHPHDVDAYASSIYYDHSNRDPAAQASAWAVHGYTAIKIKVGRISLAEDLRRVQAVRAAVGPQMKLMADANQSCDAMSAIALAKALQEFDVFWLEEPVAARDFEAHRQVKQESLMRIAAGESLHTLEDFQLLIAGNLVDVVQLNVGRVGGIDRAIELSRWAKSVRVAIHHWGTPIGLAASLHLACCLPPELGVLVEVDLSPNPLRSVVRWPENARPHGRIAPPCGPGLGLDPDEAALSRFMRREETLVSKT